MIGRIAILCMLALSSCITSDVEINNKTELHIDHDKVMQAVHRLWDGDVGGLIIAFVPPDGGAIDSHRDGPLQAAKIQVVYEGDLADSSLVHELIHWRLNKMYGHGDFHHSVVDWLLEDIVNEELRE